MNAENSQATEDQVTEDLSAASQDSGEVPASEDFTSIESAVPGESHEPGLHEALLEGVSADALTIGTAESAESAAVQTETVSEAVQASPAEDLTVVPEVVADSTANATVDVATATVETLTEALPETIGEALPEPVAKAMPEAVTKLSFLPVPALMDFRGLMDLSKAPRIADVMGEFGEVNATVFSYLRDEGNAALAHWQALFGAKTPADAIRIQVDEIQRAADASLNCFSTLAQRASRFTGTIGRA